MAAVRMGELVVSSTADDEIMAIGLGSCIGLALIDRAAQVAGLAHIVLPSSNGMKGPAAKFADTGVPELIQRMQKAGATKTRFEVVMVGGARMFAIGSELDIGSRNTAAVKAALSRTALRVNAAATGGNRGRTVRVNVGEGAVSVQEAGGERVALIGPGALRGRVAATGV